MIISIADLHGRVDLLKAMLAFYPPETHFVCLGDVIDRGPNSLDCVDIMLELFDAGRATLLRGNHEQMALEALEKFEQYKGANSLDRYKASLVAYGRWMDAGGETVTEEREGFSLESMPQSLCRYLRLTTIVKFVSVLGLTDTPPMVPSVLCSHAAPPHAREGMSQTATALWLRPQDGPYPLPEFVDASILHRFGRGPNRTTLHRALRQFDQPREPRNHRFSDGPLKAVSLCCAQVHAVSYGRTGFTLSDPLRRLKYKQTSQMSNVKRQTLNSKDKLALSACVFKARVWCGPHSTQHFARSS
jgi:serine/threonine protein phosphatase 1